ncbi:VOC family protein [Rhodopirellula sp. MGV]|uniref:VOC family protein n=1 Tax=Rhodopirellula sp. MGV TaxID=2023130 RepID=UPI000B969DA1|nr:VOC family protein [Rhodopirellula sp. MGV]OYP29975.1 glyoxalase [Rhodopirellula sp. MGV]PNY33431.1 VOC family protein [Rhodopirellula baltica]
MSLPSRINLVTLGVHDVAASTAFYERLGWHKSTASNESVTFFRSNGTVLGLFSRSSLAEDAQVPNSHPGFSGVTLAQNFDSEADVDAAYQHALDCGAKAVKDPEKVFWGGYSGYFADPDGHLWELAHNPFMPLNDNQHMELP